MKRTDGRLPDELRPVEIIRNYIEHAEGSALIKVGKTEVICTASVEEGVPRWLSEVEQGWVTAEYAMLPRATNTRSRRESKAGKQGGRTLEIQRLIGRSLRSVIDLKTLPQLTIYIDADVIKADGGTRTASITGCFVALYDAISYLQKEKTIAKSPITDIVAATSVGIIDGKAALDLSYEEDSKADVDMNVVMTSSSKFIEVQGTAEKEPFDKEQLETMLSLASNGIKQLIQKQKETLGIA